METRGRKPSIYPQQEIENIVYRFTQEEKVTGWIKYSEVYRYANRLYENGEVKYKLSEDYWRRDGRQGKEIIDKANKLYEATFINKKTAEIDVYVDTEECVNKFFSGKPSDKKKLINALRINEKKAKDSNKLLEKIEDLKQELSNQKDKNKELQELIDQQQMILFSWFNASHKSDVPLINLITTGKSRHPMVDLFFETAFSNPMEGYEKFEEYRKNNKHDENEDNKNNVVIPIKKSRLQAITEKFNDK
ncbi:hypothetical protein D1953_10850 [Peribacillus asahii]|uniref:Uncharacterized protein n=1 Tax=Peribacillus asahii TaxID=228899 RepID=A0A398B750_9BACI|nr:hypothetical protein [Peribacillus asahii]RID85314.1 hypothetical protein D1953_10850 [Peribacillus asahii]USK59392.1 hypothetical protein LIT37_19830 [Peribacillus asahii]